MGIKKGGIHKEKNDSVWRNIGGAFAGATLLCVILILMNPTQDTGDDAFIAWQLSRGAGSIASFISPYLSLIISFLFEMIPQIPWWSVFHLGSAWCLLCITLYMVNKYYWGILKYILFFASFSMTWIAIIQKMNFTRTATGYALAGGILVLEITLKKEKRSRKCFVKAFLGILLIILGGMIRFQAALLVFPFIVICALCIEVFKKKYRIKAMIFEKKELKYFVVFIAITMSILLSFLDNMYWNSHKKWKEYNEYNSIRSEIADYVDEYPNWETAKEEYLKIGLKEENDLDLLFSIVYVGDTDIYNTETLKKITDLRDSSRPLIEKLYGTKVRVLSMLEEGKLFFWIILIMCIMLYYYGKKSIFPILINLACIFSFLLVFSYKGRMMLRVWEPTLLCMIWCIIIMFAFMDCSKGNEQFVLGLEFLGKRKSEPREIGRKIKISSNLIIIFACMFVCVISDLVKPLVNLSIPSYSVDRDEITRARADYINDTRDRIYLLSQPLIHHPPNPGVFGLWEPLPKNYYPNYFALSNWDARTPTNIIKMKGYGIDNPTKALINRSDTYSDYNNKVFEFLKCHYGENITCSKVDEFKDGGSIVQYTSVINTTQIESRHDIKIDIENLGYQRLDDEDSLYISGIIDNTDVGDIDVLYCNLKIGDDLRTYRLSLKEGKFKANLYGIAQEYGEDQVSFNFIAETKDGELVDLGMVEPLT